MALQHHFVDETDSTSQTLLCLHNLWYGIRFCLFLSSTTGEKTIRFCLVTDAGHVTSDIRHYLSKADHIVIESNHDVDMLMNGPYPIYLKRRVRGEGGHLSNAECGELLHDIYHPSLRHVFLCHLSDENNDPDIAYRTASKVLASEGVQVGKDVVLSVLMRNSPSLLYNFGEF